MTKTITVSDDTWQKLSNIKVKNMNKTLDITINKLLDKEGKR